MTTVEGIRVELLGEILDVGDGLFLRPRLGHDNDIYMLVRFIADSGEGSGGHSVATFVRTIPIAASCAADLYQFPIALKNGTRKSCSRTDGWI